GGATPAGVGPAPGGAVPPQAGGPTEPGVRVPRPAGRLLQLWVHPPRRSGRVDGCTESCNNRLAGRAGGKVWPPSPTGRSAPLTAAATGTAAAGTGIATCHQPVALWRVRAGG